MAKSFNATMKARFTKITNDYGKVNAYVHETAMMIAAHALEHGDCSTAQGLVMAMPASTRRSMLILWFATYTPIVVKDDDKFVAKLHKPESKSFVPFDLTAGSATPFYTLAEQNPEGKILDFAALLKLVEGLGKRIEKKVEDGKVAPEDIESARQIALTITGLKFSRVVPVAPAQQDNDQDDNEAVEEQEERAA